MFKDVQWVEDLEYHQNYRSNMLKSMSKYWEVEPYRHEYGDVHYQKDRKSNCKMNQSAETMGGRIHFSIDWGEIQQKLGLPPANMG